MIEWDQPSRLNTPVGDLLFNQPMTLFDGETVGYFMIDPERMGAAGRGIRATKDPVPQGDGAILHRRFTDGTELALVVEFWKEIAASAPVGEGEKACDQDLRLMLETLGYYLQSVLNGRGRWFWEPSGYGDERMLDECRWLVAVARTLQAGLTSATFTIDSQFPCFIDATEISGSDVFIAGGDTVTLFNDGNHDAYPVLEVFGSTSSFTITNNSLVDQDGDPLKIVYDGTTIAGGDFAEIDTFRNTIYLNGNEANLKAGIDAQETDFFVLRPGENVIESGVDVQFKYNNSWVPC